MPADDLRDATRQALDHGAARLRALELSRPAQALAPWVLKAFRRRDYDGVMTGINRLREDLRQIDAVLCDVHEKVSSAETANAQAAPFGDAWCNIRQRRVRDARDAADHPALIAEWVGTWVEALVAERFELGAQVSDWAAAGTEHREVARTMTAVVSALGTGDLTLALIELDRLLALTRKRLRPDSLVPLLVLRARLLLRSREDVRAAAVSADEALAACRPDRGVVRPDTHAVALAVKAQVELVAHQLHDSADALDAARAHLRQAVDLDAAPADPFILAGALEEMEGNWAVADEHYDEAFRRDGVSVTSEQLLRPVPANLFWLVARRLRADDPERALAAMDSALTLGVGGEGEFVECAALLDKAAILERLDRRPEAAQTYAAAGNRYIWADAVARGADFLDRACRLAPEVAEHRWCYAEALRTLALDVDGVADPTLMERAKRQLDTGLGLAEPGVEHAWVFVTAAMIAVAMDDAATDPVLLVERTLLLDGEYATAYGFLAMLLNARGFAEAAHEAADRAYELEPFDLFVIRQLVGSLANLGRYDQALEVIDRYLDSEPDDADALCDRSWMLLRLGAVNEALVTLSAAEPSERAIAMLGLCHTAQGDEDRALAEYRTIWDGQLTGVGRQGLAWAGYRLGHLDEAIRIVAELSNRMPSHASFACDLGQLRLVRGDPAHHDLAEGERILRQGIEGTLVADYLAHLADLEFPVARRAVQTADHRAEVERILDDLERVVCRRRRELRSQVRPRGPAAIAAAGRVALRHGRPEPALAAYRELLGFPDIPEARRGLAAAVRLAFDHGDRLAALGDPAAAKQLWNRTRPVLRGLPDGPDRYPQLGRLAARLAVADLAPTGPAPLGPFAGDSARLDSEQLDEEQYDEARFPLSKAGTPGAGTPRAGTPKAGTSGTDTPGTGAPRDGVPAADAADLARPPDARAVTRAMLALFRLPTADAEQHLVEALGVFVHDGRSLWVQHDRLLALAADGPFTADQRAVLTRAAGRLPLTRVYRLARAVVSDEVIFPAVTALEVRFGPGLRPLMKTPPMAAEIARLRARLARETGIEIPGVRVRGADEVRPGSVEYLVHEQLVDSVSVSVPVSESEPSDGGQVLVLTALERVVREHLFRLFTVDDVGLWLSEWGSDHSEAPWADEALDDAARIRLSRVLRLLLREGVPIADRDAVLAGFRDAEPAGSAESEPESEPESEAESEAGSVGGNSPAGGGPAEEAGLLTAVRAVRRRLGPAVLCRPAGTPVHAIPAEVQERLCAGVDPRHGIAWEADRAEAVELLAGLRSWLTSLPAGPRLVSVREPRIRPIVWRLLASERPPVSVLAEEELA